MAAPADGWLASRCIHTSHASDSAKDGGDGGKGFYRVGRVEEGRGWRVAGGDGWLESWLVSWPVDW